MPFFQNDTNISICWALKEGETNFSQIGANSLHHGVTYNLENCNWNDVFHHISQITLLETIKNIFAIVVHIDPVAATGNTSH